MMDILTEARKHSSRPADPEKAAAAEARKAKVLKAVRDAYDALRPLSGMQAQFGKDRVRLAASCMLDVATLAMTRRVVVPQGARKYGNGRPIVVEPGEVWYKDTGDEVGRWTIGASAGRYIVNSPISGQHEVAQLVDVVRLLGGEIGPLLLE